jgi:hypothetical protein
VNQELFEVRKGKLSETRQAQRAIPELEDGEILARVDSFALTANNITYGVVGDQFGYWQFFPATEGWGIIPVWGFAEVVQTRHPEVMEGERLYGYFPMGSHLVLRPGNISEGSLLDETAHRASLPAVYNHYVRTAAEPHYDSSMDDERMLLFPLYATSFCLYDFLKDNEYFGASQIVITSASSKTAIGLAYGLKAEEASPACVALTSAGNLEKVNALGLYDSVTSYSGLTDIDATRSTVIVDMSGNGEVLSDLHAWLGDNMKYTSNVGATHHEANDMGPNFIRERSAMFFAPSHIQKRTRDWGPGEFGKRAFRFWYQASIKSRDWLVIRHHQGMQELPGLYLEVLEGKAVPDEGIIVSL